MQSETVATSGATRRLKQSFSTCFNIFQYYTRLLRNANGVGFTSICWGMLNIFSMALNCELGRIYSECHSGS